MQLEATPRCILSVSNPQEAKEYQHSDLEKSRLYLLFSVTAVANGPLCIDMWNFVWESTTNVGNYVYGHCLYLYNYVDIGSGKLRSYRIYKTYLN
jgi:hypothetical protein